jgi:hypothetical protein
MIAYRAFPNDLYTGFVQPLGHPCTVGIDNLADQQFIANSDYFRLHPTKMGGIPRTPKNFWQKNCIGFVSLSNIFVNQIHTPMRRYSNLTGFLCLIAFSFAIPAKGQIDINGALNTINQSLGQGLSNDKIVSGLKEALNRGSNTSSEKASKIDGFYKNPAIKIPFPKEAKDMENTLKTLGMQKQVDSFVKSLNRAAEDAAKKAAPVFLKAITTMTITDGMNILKGGNTAATDFLQSKTTPDLKKEFSPIVKTSLAKVQVTKYWTPLAKSYNKVPMVKKVNPNLEEYVTAKAIEGLFKLVAEEEAKIRKDPVATGSALLQEVFGKR